MSIRIALDKPQEFYTNLDFVSGRVILSLQRPETIGNVIVKLEGESRTALAQPSGDYLGDHGRAGSNTGPGSIITENHKILYRVFQVYPDDGVALPFQPGQHEFKFNFKVPLNNICHDPKAMSALMGVAGAGTPALFGGMGGFRTMDGMKQLMLRHLKATLPPSLTGFPQEAEIRYYIKVTIQRPGFFKENWRYQVGFKFLPIEPPRPAKTKQEAFARRPFTFKARPPALAQKKSSFFGSSSGKSKSPAQTPTDEAGKSQEPPPSIEMSARVPYPSILTCNQPIPLRLIAKKLAPSTGGDPVFLKALEITLVGYTNIRVQNLSTTERTVWVVLSANNLSISLFKSPADPVGSEFELPNDVWAQQRLPNTVAPSFRTCNLSRRYEIEMKLSLAWGGPPPPPSSGSSSWIGKGGSPNQHPQVITLPLKLSNVEVYSGIKPPAGLLDALANQPPHLPPRPSISHASASAPPAAPSPHRPPLPPSDPLYPPQLGPGNIVLDEAPPSYDEAMADRVAAPEQHDRPAYSGVTAENAPSTMPREKSGPH